MSRCILKLKDFGVIAMDSTVTVRGLSRWPESLLSLRDSPEGPLLDVNHIKENS